MFLVDKSKPELGLWRARLSVQLVLDRRTAKSILRAYRCSPLLRQDKHAKAAHKKCVMRKGQIRAGCGWLSFSVSLDANKTTWRLFTIGCDTLEAASAWLQRCHVDSEKNSKIPQRKGSGCFLICFESNTRAWWRVLGLKCFGRAADRRKDCSKQQSSRGHWCSPAIMLKTNKLVQN